MSRFIKYNPDSDMAKYLQTKPIANHLANIIATRARRTDCHFTGLKVGQCYLGDYKKIGITPKQYRTAKKLLEKIGFSTFLGTNKGTTATLVSIEVYDINVSTRGEQEDKPQGEQGGEQGANKGRQTKNEKKEKNDKELKELKNISDYKNLVSFFIEQTGKSIRIAKTDSLILKQGNYKLVSARLNEGITIEEMKGIINLKNSQWRNDKRNKQYIRFETLFAPVNIQKYLNEIDNSNTTETGKKKKFPYTLPELKTPEERQNYFLARWVAYKPFLDERLNNTEYRQRAIYQQDAEGLCFELELKFPNLLDIDFKYKTMNT
jgi:uncharacterized phage protein (TIGR02220 family)